jgi:probable phosphoglycerate mutase
MDFELRPARPQLRPASGSARLDGGNTAAGAAQRADRSIRSSLALVAACLCAVGSLACHAGRIVPLSDVDREEPARLTVYLVRHAEAYRNVSVLLRPRGLSESELDSLTPRGAEQAGGLGRALASENLALVLTSPAQRTRQTADAIARAAGLEGAQVEPAFASLREGAQPDGQRTTLAWRRSQWKAGRDPRPEGGESLRDGLARARARIEQIAAERPGARIAVVSHGDIVAALLGHAEGTPILDRLAVHDVAGGSISVLTLYDAPRWRVESEGNQP